MSSLSNTDCRFDTDNNLMTFNCRIMLFVTTFFPCYCQFMWIIWYLTMLFWCVNLLNDRNACCWVWHTSVQVLHKGNIVDAQRDFSDFDLSIQYVHTTAYFIIDITLYLVIRTIRVHVTLLHNEFGWISTTAKVLYKLVCFFIITI